MRLRVFSLVFLLTGAAAVWACSLNPQPLPPDTNDASASKDGGMTYTPEAGGAVDSGSNDDGAIPSGSDGGSEDATTDAPSDGGEDASDAADAGDDG